MKTSIYRVRVNITPKKYEKVIETLVCTETNKGYKLEDHTLMRSYIRKNELNSITDGVIRNSDRTIIKECYCLEGEVEEMVLECQREAHKVFLSMYNNINSMWEQMEDEAKTVYKLRQKENDN